MTCLINFYSKLTYCMPSKKMTKGNEFYIWDHGIICPKNHIIHAKRVWELPNQMIYEDNQRYTRTFYRQESLFSLCGLIGKYSVISYDNKFCKLHTENVPQLFIYNNDTKNFDAFGRSTTATIVEDAIKIFYGHKFRPELVVYPKLIYDHSQLTYRINRNSYCDMIIYTED